MRRLFRFTPTQVLEWWYLNLLGEAAWVESTQLAPLRLFTFSTTKRLLGLEVPLDILLDYLFGSLHLSSTCDDMEGLITLPIPINGSSSTLCI